MARDARTCVNTAAASAIGRVSTKVRVFTRRTLSKSDLTRKRTVARALLVGLRAGVWGGRTVARVQRFQALRRAHIRPGAVPDGGAQAALSDGRIEVRPQPCPIAGSKFGHQLGDEARPEQPDARPGVRRAGKRRGGQALASRKSPVGCCGGLGTIHRWASQVPPGAGVRASRAKSKSGANTSAATYQNGVSPSGASSGSAFFRPPAVSSAPPWSRPSSA